MKIYIKSSSFDMLKERYKKLVIERIAEVEKAAKRIARKNGLKVKISSDTTPSGDILAEMNIDVYNGTEYITTFIVDAYTKGWAIQSPENGKLNYESHNKIIESMERSFWWLVN